MKKFLLMLTILFNSINVFAQVKLDGAYKIIFAQHGSDTSIEAYEKTTIIKTFKNGYWITAFFGDPAKSFNGSGGGTYKIEGNHYTETLNFCSWDSTAAGQTYTFNYKLQGNKYTQESIINSPKLKEHIIKENYEKINAASPLIDASLDGVWQLDSAIYADKKPGEFINRTAIKIYAYPRFAWAHYNSVTRQFIAAGGGTYQFDGKKVIEKLEYISRDIPVNTAVEISITAISNDKFSQLNHYNGHIETWKRLTH